MNDSCTYVRVYLTVSFFKWKDGVSTLAVCKTERQTYVCSFIVSFPKVCSYNLKNGWPDTALYGYIWVRIIQFVCGNMEHTYKIVCAFDILLLYVHLTYCIRI